MSTFVSFGPIWSFLHWSCLLRALHHSSPGDSPSVQRLWRRSTHHHVHHQELSGQLWEQSYQPVPEPRDRSFSPVEKTRSTTALSLWQRTLGILSANWRKDLWPKSQQRWFQWLVSEQRKQMSQVHVHIVHTVTLKVIRQVRNHILLILGYNISINFQQGTNYWINSRQWEIYAMYSLTISWLRGLLQHVCLLNNKQEPGHG